MISHSATMIGLIVILSPVTAHVQAAPRSEKPPPFVDSGPIFPTDLVYRHTTHTNATAPTKLEVPGLELDQHGTYERHPYYVFIDDKKTGDKWLISDSHLRVKLKLIPGSDGSRVTPKGTKFPVAKYYGEIKRSDYDYQNITNLVISINDPLCRNEECFRVIGTDDFADLPSGDDQNTVYVPEAPRPDDKNQLKIPWVSAFVAKPHDPLYYAFSCWNVTKLHYANYQPITCSKQILSLPPDDSRNYTQFGPMNLPWGWLFDSVDYSSGSSYSRMLTRSTDITDSLQRTTGFNASGKLIVNIPGVTDSSASFSYKREDGTAHKFEKMYQSETVYTEHQYYYTQYAVVVEKINGGLAPDFVGDVNGIRSLAEQHEDGTLTQKHLENFLKEYGTHFANAITYGTQGTATFSMNKSQVENLIAEGVNVSEAWSADAKVTVMGVGGEIGGGSDDAEAKDMQKKFSRIVNVSKENYHCSGGASCDGGKPSGTPLVPVFLDLRPISELLAPPYFKHSDDATIVLGLRDRLEQAISDYAILQIPDEGDVTGKATMTMDEPLCDDVPCSLKWPNATYYSLRAFLTAPPGMLVRSVGPDIPEIPDQKQAEKLASFWFRSDGAWGDQTIHLNLMSKQETVDLSIGMVIGEVFGEGYPKGVHASTFDTGLKLMKKQVALKGVGTREVVFGPVPLDTTFGADVGEFSIPVVFTTVRGLLGMGPADTLDD